jgi:hypothetical protein
MAFNYGNHANFGAVGHWGGCCHDVGWIDNSLDPATGTGAPEKNKWHLLAYTYDGSTTRVYSDGTLWNEEDTQALWGDLNTYPEPPIAIASQWNDVDPTMLNAGLKGSLSIGRMRIHDGVLSEAQLLANYNEERASFVNPPVIEPPKPEPLRKAPIHRYSFNDAAAADATGKTIVDSVGGANGIVRGDGSSLSGTQLSLDGGPSATAAYVDLPNGIISKLTNATVEGWVTIEGEQSWARLFDFGSTLNGEELDEAGGGGEGQDYFMLSASRGTNISQQRFELRNNDPDSGGPDEGTVGPTQQILDTEIPTELDEKFHFAAIYDGTGATSVLRQYRNGEFVGEQGVDIELQNINDVNNWLGRSNWTNDANLQGSYDEFRIYDYVLSENEILGNVAAGPNTVNVRAGGDLTGDGKIDAMDIDAIAAAVRTVSNDTKFDVNGDGQINDTDRRAYVRTTVRTWLGDSNLDKEFSSSDFVSVFIIGEYEDAIALNSGWADGDWNGDGDFSSSDFVAAFVEGGYEKGPLAATPAGVPEPASLTLTLLGAMGLWHVSRRRR